MGMQGERITFVKEFGLVDDKGPMTEAEVMKAVDRFQVVRSSSCQAVFDLDSSGNGRRPRDWLSARSEGPSVPGQAARKRLIESGTAEEVVKRFSRPSGRLLERERIPVCRAAMDEASQRFCCCPIGKWARRVPSRPRRRIRPSFASVASAIRQDSRRAGADRRAFRPLDVRRGVAIARSRARWPTPRETGRRRIAPTHRPVLRASRTQLQAAKAAFAVSATASPPPHFAEICITRFVMK